MENQENWKESFNQHLEGNVSERICFMAVPVKNGELEKPHATVLKQEHKYEIDGLIEVKKNIAVKGK
jgi:hypothetical protein